MNLQQLIKLIKLANNNPNEHEANSASRKVCKLIEEDKFDCLNKEKNNSWDGTWYHKDSSETYRNTYWGQPRDYYTKSEPKKRYCIKCNAEITQGFDLICQMCIINTGSKIKW